MTSQSSQPSSSSSSPKLVSVHAGAAVAAAQAQLDRALLCQAHGHHKDTTLAGMHQVGSAHSGSAGVHDLLLVHACPSKIEGTAAISVACAVQGLCALCVDSLGSCQMPHACLTPSGSYLKKSTKLPMKVSSPAEGPVSWKARWSVLLSVPPKIVISRLAARSLPLAENTSMEDTCLVFQLWLTCSQSL